MLPNITNIILLYNFIIQIYILIVLNYNKTGRCFLLLQYVQPPVISNNFNEVTDFLILGKAINCETIDFKII